VPAWNGASTVALHLPSTRLAAATGYNDLPAPAQSAKGYTAVFIVPTGIGAAIGGYAGDALPTARYDVGSTHMSQRSQILTACLFAVLQSGSQCSGHSHHAP
jgi:Protein of unknown function (DUF3326)